MLWASIIFGLISAVAWFLAAVVPPAVVGTYWDEPPKHIQDRLRWGPRFNAIGALFASMSMACQALVAMSAS